MRSIVFTPGCSSVNCHQTQVSNDESYGIYSNSQNPSQKHLFSFIKFTSETKSIHSQVIKHDVSYSHLTKDFSQVYRCGNPYIKFCTAIYIKIPAHSKDTIS